VWTAYIASETFPWKPAPAAHQRLLDGLTWAVARASGWLARALRRVARRLEAIEGAASGEILELLPEDLMLADEPPPIPAAALRRPALIARTAIDHERAWQALTSGQNPLLLTGPLSQPALSRSAAAHV
jgi:hypothetical protein